MNSYFELARDVLQIAKERGYNSTTLAKLCNVSRMSTSRWLKGERNISYDKLFILMRELKLVIILCETEEQSSES